MNAPHAISFYRRFVPPGGLCFDVGANFGSRTEVFLRLGARVVAVEPQPACAAELRARFGASVTVVEAALGGNPGDADLHVASYHTLSSLSPEWITEVRNSGRFADFTGTERLRVDVTTLDALVAEWGVPDFCKIDVEGYELEVIQGLSSLIPALSFEFTRERLDSRLATVAHLEALGMERFNFSFGESFELAFSSWVTATEMKTFLQSSAHTPSTFGDVYAVAGPPFRELRTNA